MHKKVYFITGGGTGGHIYPAIAVADELSKLENTGNIFYVGNPDNLEANIAKSKNYKFLPVKSSGMPRKVSLAFISWTVKMFFAWLKCCFYILKYKPDTIFGTGGYVSAPVLFAAITTRTPFIMHDCDAIPGLVTRKLSPFAKSISIAFDSAKKYLQNKNCITNGNPIREEFKTLAKEQARKVLNLENKLTLCIMGGSQGAKTINNAAIQILERLSKDYNLQVIFQTGKNNFDQTVKDLQKTYPEFAEDKNIIIKPYFEDMVTVLKSSDIAISRAGSLSISELCASGVATIYIPYPHAAADHQRKNAKYMLENNAGLYLEDNNTTPETLLDSIKTFIYDTNKLQEIQSATTKLAKYDGVKKIVEQILN